MGHSTDLNVKLALAAFLLVSLACGLGSIPTPERPVNTLAAGQQYLGPTLSSPSEYRPSAAGWIAFVKEGNLWLIHPDGTDPKQVTKDGSASASAGGELNLAWSTDGQLLAFSQGGVLSVLNIAGLGTRVLANDTAGGFDWSATAHQIVYDTALAAGPSGAQANAGLSVISADDGSSRLLAKSSAATPAMLDPLWSFDSRSVIFSESAGGRLHLLHADTGAITTLLPGSSVGTRCTWSPVELLIACVDDQPPQGQPLSVVLLDQDAAEQKRIPLPAGHTHPHLGPWSPDGGSLAIIYSTGPEGFEEKTDILSLDTGEFQTLGPGRAASWSPDARWVATVSASSAGARASGPITVINAISGLSATIADGSSPVWQPAASTDLAGSAGTASPQGPGFCLNTAVGFVHIKPKGHYLIFCIGAQKYNYGALADGVYLIGPQTKFFIYVSNSGYVFAARMGDPTLTRIGNVRSFRAVHTPTDPKFEIRLIPGYPHLVQVVEKRFNQKETFTLPRRIFAP